MALIAPFRGFLPKRHLAKKILAPPYDVISTEQARQLVVNNNYSFLHLSKPEIDFDADHQLDKTAIYQQGAKTWQRFLEQMIIEQDDQAHYYLYQIDSSEFKQTGLVAMVDIGAYRNKRLRLHEKTQPSKETDRREHLQAVHAQFSPVLLSYLQPDDLSQRFAEICQQHRPAREVIGPGEHTYRLWRISNANDILIITQSIDALEALYVADGHHRCAAANGISNLNRFLAVLFTETELNILGYHRLISAIDSPALLQQLQACFSVQPLVKPTLPEALHHLSICSLGQWYQVILNNPQNEALPVDLLTEQILEPKLNITDQRTDPRVRFVGGIDALESLTQSTQTNPSSMAFVLYPTTVYQIRHYADQALCMPPKSTWFEPKLADGLIAADWD